MTEWIRRSRTGNLFHIPNMTRDRGLCGIKLSDLREQEPIEDPLPSERCSLCEQERLRRPSATQKPEQ